MVAARSISSWRGPFPVRCHVGRKGKPQRGTKTTKKDTYANQPTGVWQGDEEIVRLFVDQARLPRQHRLEDILTGPLGTYQESPSDP